MTVLAVTIVAALLLRRFSPEGRVRSEHGWHPDGSENGYWYSDGDHTEPTPKEWL